MTEGQLPETQLDQKNFFSWKRAKRGAIRGAKIGAGFALGSLALGTAGALLFETDGAAITDLIQHPMEVAQFGVEYTLLTGGYGGAIGGVIDSIRPVSRLFGRYIQNEIKQAKEIPDNLRLMKNDLVSAYRFLSKVDYPKVAYDVLRPDVPRTILERKKRFLTSTTSAGAFISAGMWGAFSAMDSFDKWVGWYDPKSPVDNMLSSIHEHPLEIIAISAALSFGAAAYPLLFHRPLPPEDSFVDYH